MSEAQPKWIIEGPRLIIGKVTNHSQLATNMNKVRGGGWWHMDRESKHITLYGSSADFGYASLEAVSDAIQAGECHSSTRECAFNDWSFSYSTRYKLEDAEKDAIPIPKVKPVKEDDV